jgi:hypothetical protein
MSLHDVKQHVATSADAAATAQHLIGSAVDGLESAVRSMRAATQGTSRSEPEAIAQRLNAARQSLQDASHVVALAVDAAQQFGRAL